MIALKTYNKKRNFKDSPEPKGVLKKTKQSRFVVQRHDATRLHYDFRLELDGVLKSWAVPKGPSMNPKDKRLAVQVEDHPVSYIHFEGTIPEGNYGAGTVEVWDKGSFHAVDKKGNILSERDALKNLESGEIKFELKGEKLNGGFVLVQLKDGKRKNWLLIKHRDEYATEEALDDTPVSKIRRSAESPGRETLRGSSAQIASSKTKNTTKKKGEVEGDITISNKKYKEFIKPMFASSTEKPFDSNEWLYELKLDGYRAIAEVGKKFRLYSRNGLSFEEKYPPVVEALKKIKKKAVLDGEIVLLVDNKPDFQKLQHYDGHREYPLVYYAFDILSLEGKDLTKLPLIERKKILKKFLSKNKVIRYSDHVEDNGTEFFEQVKAQQIEGIVAKKKDSRYHEGARSKEWLKIKHQNTQEAIIAGYTSPRGGRKHFGALILGEYNNGELKYIGHTGTGFNEQALKDLWEEMQPLISKTSPFEERVKVNQPVTWIKPKLVCEISYTEITKDQMRRHPVFLRLRPDKNADEVTADARAVVKKETGASASSKQKTKVSSKQKIKDRPAKTSKSKKDDDDKSLSVNGKKLTLTNLDKIYWPDEGITKGDMINYYNDISSFILPYLRNRPMSLKRNPNGIKDQGFFHKDAGEQAPSWMKTADLHSESANKVIHYLLCNDKPSLLYIANLGCIELNPWNSTTKDLEKPTYMVIDIDPSDKNTFDEVIEAALATKSILDKAGADSYCKTSGATGLHVYVPMGNKYDYEQVKDFAHLISIMTQALLPDTTSIERILSKRGPNIYIDYLQNRGGQTLATAYSLRPREGATVSTPLEWSEVKEGLHPSQFTMHNILDRIKKKGDLFAPVLKKGIDLVKCLKKLEG
jgi:bifunctional non-homologous end joining protein LigD